MEKVTFTVSRDDYESIMDALGDAFRQDESRIKKVDEMRKRLEDRNDARHRLIRDMEHGGFREVV